jgi:hypothetical protein
MARKGGVKTVFKALGAKCHPTKPLYAQGKCRSCYEKQLRKLNPEFAERQRENQRQWVLQHHERKRESDKAYRAKLDPEYRRARSLWSNHRITVAQYTAILKEQKGRCAICGRKQRRHLAVDHNHKTGEIRGLLCFRCNFGLSWFQEDAQTLKQASKHVTKCINLEKYR